MKKTAELPASVCGPILWICSILPKGLRRMIIVSAWLKYESNLSVNFIEKLDLSYTSGDDYDNCLLSDKAYSNIDSYNDLDYDLSWNVYVVTGSSTCYNDNYQNTCYQYLNRLLKILVGS